MENEAGLVSEKLELAMKVGRNVKREFKKMTEGQGSSNHVTSLFSIQRFLSRSKDNAHSTTKNKRTLKMLTRQSAARNWKGFYYNLYSLNLKKG